MASLVNTDLKEGKICLYQGRTCMILSVTSELGFRRFHLIDLDDGKQYLAHKHELSKYKTVNDNEQGSGDESDEDEKSDQMHNIDESSEEPMPEVPQPEVKQPELPSRFATTSEQDLADIESHTKAKTTHNQTKWGVKIFKGR